MIASKASLSKPESNLTMAHMWVAFMSLLIGGLMGLLQTFVRTGKFELPWGIGYYQILTVHGVLLALVLTTFFIIGFQFSLMIKTVGMTAGELKAAWVAFYVMLIGTAITATMILLGKASVLYTFYAPLQAHPLFYIGLTLVIVGTWIACIVNFRQLYKWKKRNPGQKSPLLAYMVVINQAIWAICTLGVAATVLIQFIPWSLGLVDEINVLVSRTLFWYFGHPLVYFWLLPAYMCWYGIIPKIIGGKIFSDSLARLAFILFLLFSIPVGFHHQLLEPGIDPFWKYIQVVLTFAVAIPSLLTAFSMFATFEIRGRSLGYTGLFGWFKNLPWKDVRFFAPMMGMIAFIPAGAGGLVNASYQLNQVIHNTIWVTGHFHLTLATTVILTFFGISYWLVPSITGRKLDAKTNKLGIIQTIVWLVGMFFMSGSMHIQGLLGAPRRSAFSEYGGTEQAANWVGYQIGQAVGGSILFIGVLIMVYTFIYMAFLAPKGETEFPIAEEADDAPPTPMVLENWKLWIGISIVLILFAYTIPFIDIIQNSPPGSPPFAWPIGNN